MMAAEQLPTPGEFQLSTEEARSLELHPYCLWFPPLDATDFESLSDSIESQGLLEPIILLNRQVFDGRHRLKACLEREVAPRFQNFETLTPQIDPIDWVLAKNQYRRHLAPDQFLGIVTKVNAERLRLEGLRKKHEGQRSGGPTGGRGHKKTLTLNSESRFERDSCDRNARSTAGRLAKDAGVSRDKAEKALRVMRKAPELLDQIVAGKISVAAAEKSLPKPSKIPKPPQIGMIVAEPEPWNFSEQFEKCRKYLAHALNHAPAPKQRDRLRERLIEFLNNPGESTAHAG